MLPWPSQAKLPGVFVPVPPHLPELEDASCADILGRGDLHWAVLAVLIELQDLHPQLHFARHLAPPAQQGWVVPLGCLGVYFSQEKELKHPNTKLRVTEAAINALLVSSASEFS